MTAPARSLALLRAVYSRTFGVCALCPHGAWLPGFGSPIAHWVDDDDLGRWGVCESCHAALIACHVALIGGAALATYIVPIPDDMPPLNLNVRLHWAQRNRLTQQWRAITAAAVRRRQIPPLPRCTVTLHVTPPDRRRRDSGNYVLTHKAALDGLVDAGVVPDDSPEFVVERMPVLHEPDGSKRWKWWLVVEPVAGTQHGDAA